MPPCVPVCAQYDVPSCVPVCAQVLTFFFVAVFARVSRSYCFFLLGLRVWYVRLSLLVSALPMNIGMRAETDSGNFAGSVVFGLNHIKTFDLSNGPHYTSKRLSLSKGEYLLSATAYQRANATGHPSPALHVFLTVALGATRPSALRGSCFMWGFGHFLTFDRLIYDFHGEGEYIAYATADEMMTVSIFRPNDNGPATVSGVAIRSGLAGKLEKSMP